MTDADMKIVRARQAIRQARGHDTDILVSAAEQDWAVAALDRTARDLDIVRALVALLHWARS